jgi:predicted small metal-binding protein
MNIVKCEWGYVASGDTEEEVIADARRHALEAHGMDVPPEQIRALAEKSPQKDG